MNTVVGTSRRLDDRDAESKRPVGQMLCSILASGVLVGSVLLSAAAAQSGGRGATLNQDISVGSSRAASSTQLKPLDVTDKNLIDVTRYIEETANVNIMVAESLQDQKVTLHLYKALGWLDLLKVIADAIDADLQMITEDTVKLHVPPRVALEFRDAPVKDAIRTIARVAGKNIVIPAQIKEVDNLITLYLRNVPWDDALDVVVKSAGLVAVQDANGKVVRIAHPDELRRQLETEIFRLRFLRPSGEYRAIFATGGIGTGESGGGGGGRTFVERVALKKATELKDRFPLLEALKKTLTVDDQNAEIGRIDYDELTNTLIVRDQRTNLDDVKRIVAEIDEEPMQVQIDLKFIDTQNTDILDFGVDIFSDGLEITGGLGAFTHRLPFNIGEGGWEDSLQLSDPNTDVSTQITDSGFTFGRLDFTGLNAALRILKRDVHSRILQAPKVVALDGLAATIFVGDEVRYAESEAIINELGNPTVTVQEAEDSPVQVGFQLLVIPHVIRGTDAINMTVIPANTSLTGPFGGFDRFQVAGQTLDLPRLTSSTVVTHMIVQNGHTAVIGGLYTETEANTVNKVPVLGDIPVLGYGFKNRVANSDRSNLIIFVTPRIIHDYQAIEGYLGKVMQERRAETRVDEVADLTGHPASPPPPEAVVAPIGEPAAGK